MITLIVWLSGVNITPLIRFMISAFECITGGAVLLRIVDRVRRPRLVDLAAQRREAWEAVHPAVGDAPDDSSDDD
jgi:hypothetical protein